MSVDKSTHTRILNAAEELFARKGYHATSIRVLTEHAGVNLAAANYHFGTKEALLKEVIRRRLEPLNDVRLARLNGLVSRPALPDASLSVHDIFLAFVEPTLLFWEKTPGARFFVRFIGRSMADPDNTVRSIFLGYMTPVFQCMIQLLTQALPNMPQATLFWRLHFAIGALAHAMNTMERCPLATEGIQPPNDARSMVELIIPFITAGMEA